jgi:hypothetical protein
MNIVILPGITDEESTGRMVFPLGRVQRREIHPRNRIPPGITSSWKLIKAGKIKMRENPQNGNSFSISNYEGQLFQKF